MISGMLVLSLFGYKKISREIYKHKLMKECPVIEIPVIDIKAPVLEGIDSESLKVSAGHFTGTGSAGNGNYCIAGHNSTIYAEIFNNLDQISIGDEIYLTDNDKNRTRYVYTVTAYDIVSPCSAEVLNDFGDNRLTVISCTDDGNFRQVVTGILKN